MASINGVKSALVATYVAPPKARPKPTPMQVQCAACGGIGLRSLHARGKARFQWIETNDGTMYCDDCCNFFGIGPYEQAGIHGQTDHSPEEAIERIAKAQEEKYAMILRTQSFYAPSGQSIGVDLGDIFPIQRAGLQVSDNDAPSRERTKASFSIDIMVGGNELTLFPHEFSPINFLTVMELRKSGEMEESFVGANDQSGYFSPTPEVRKQITAMFGR